VSQMPSQMFRLTTRKKKRLLVKQSG